MLHLANIFLGMPRALVFALLILLAVMFLRRIFGGADGRASRGRRRDTHRRRVCSNCATAHPGFARFCRRCGKPL